MRLLLLCGIIVLAPKVWGFKTNGRVSLGFLSSTERFSNTSSDSESNDFLRASGRFNYQISDFGSQKYQFILDIADLYDGFGKLNKLQYQLDAKNSFQLKQFNFRAPNLDGSYFYQLGRFTLMDVGSLSCDGAQFGFRPSTDFSTGFFGGLNPRRLDQIYYTFNDNSQIYGIFASFQSHNRGWNQNFVLNHSLVQEKFNGEIDRQYLYHNLFYQWTEFSRILTQMYYDFIPRGFVQIGSASWQQEWFPQLTTELGYSTIDVVTYLRQQNVREELPSSPYSEQSAAIRSHLYNRQILLEAKTISGERSLDKLKKNLNSIGVNWNQIWNRHLDLYLRFTNGKNFISQNTMTTLGLGYYSDQWEFSIDETFGTETYDNGLVLHPLISEFSLNRHFTNKLFLTTIFQSAKDERVDILSAFLKLGYRFGTQEVPPLRDGAPPRGHL